MHIGWGGEGGRGYIQKFPSTVLVPPQLYISSKHPTAHTHAWNIAYPFPKVFLSYLNLNESLKWPNIPIQWQPPPPTTPHMHNYNTIQNFVDLKIRLNQYQAINQVFVWSHNAAPLLRLEPANPSSSPISHRAPQYNQLGIEPYHAKMRLRDF